MFDYNNQATGLNFIYTGGPIITISDAQPEAETLALKNGKILVAGNQEDALKSITINAAYQYFEEKRK